MGPEWLLLAVGCGPTQVFTVELHPDQEARVAGKGPFTPATQSMVRGRHWLGSVSSAEVEVGADLVGSVTLEGDPDHSLSIRDLALDRLVPRLAYVPLDPPDAFDAFNLRMAEYSRNGANVPTGDPDDRMARFESDLVDASPVRVSADYAFEANRDARPYRIAVVNNCLGPGLWEIQANDRAGEIYHAWWTYPTEPYLALVAAANDLPPAFVAEAVAWSEAPAPLGPGLSALERLRTVVRDLGVSPVAIVGSEDPSGYSSQDSRQKLGKSFARRADGAPVATRDDLTSGPISLVEFVPPGIYDPTERFVADYGFLRSPGEATLREVRPHTGYGGVRPGGQDPLTHLELSIPFGERLLIVGNLPVAQLVPQESLVIWGYGAGILPADNPAERTRLLFEAGPHPTYAYLVETRQDGPVALNSHGLGLEQLVLRVTDLERDPHLELTLTSYERIVDLVRYRLRIPEGLVPQLRAAAESYTTPLYESYRDDNVR